jgi:hypothetical protein
MFKSQETGVFYDGVSSVLFFVRKAATLATQRCGRLRYSWYFACCTATALELSAVPAARRRREQACSSCGRVAGVK